MNMLHYLVMLIFAVVSTDAVCQNNPTHNSACETNWKEFCTESSTHWSFMKEHCKKTCGLCCQNTPKHNTNCENQWKQYCTKKSPHWVFMKQHCKKACGLCAVETTKPPTTKPPTTKPPTTKPPTTKPPTTKPKVKKAVCKDDPKQAKNCPGFKKFCKQSHKWFKWMHDHCAKTCKFCRDDCGLRGGVLGRVIGGVEAEAHSWPWSVALLRFGGYFCGGSLIDEQWVLTAAHCVYGREAHFIEAVLGDHDRSINEKTEQKFYIEKMISHEKYNPYTLNNDIALIKLNKKVTLKTDAYGNPDKIGLVCLPKQREAANATNLCYITGWGKTKSDGPTSNVLMEAAMPIVTNQKCKKKNSPQGRLTKITKNMLCAGQEPGTKMSGCHGDTGGPFVCTKNGRKWTLTGVVSWGSKRCDRSEKYTVFARVSEFRDWIDNVRHTN